MVCLGYPGGIYTSADSGTNWTLNSAPVMNWSGIAISADGGKQVAVVLGGGIYTLQTIVPSGLNITRRPGGNLLSWTVPSKNFVLQENADFTTSNWTEVAATPAINLTNLHYEVILPPTNTSRFYRLKH